ncbi:MAG: hypothetical protein ACR2JI_08715 [Mycobacterium sp.]
MSDEFVEVFQHQGGVATSAQLLAVISRRNLGTLLEAAVIERIWHGVYSLGMADQDRRLRGLDLAAGETVSICLGTAAQSYGFDTEDTQDLHVLNPAGHQLRHADGLVVHRRDGAPLSAVPGRSATTAAWTAIEVARGLRRPRALATLDAALRSNRCDRAELARATVAQAGRRGIVRVRELLPLADGRAESPMESEARLVMLDGGLPSPALQYEIVDSWGRPRRLDFAWPQFKVGAEYEGDVWHSGTDALRRDRERLAALQDLGWMVVPIVAEDVRRRPAALVERLSAHIGRAQAA